MLKLTAGKMLTILATVIYLAGVLIAFNYPKTCPIEYTQAQVDASNCIVGANIGLPFILIGLTLAWRWALKFIKTRTTSPNPKK